MNLYTMPPGPDFTVFLTDFQFICEGCKEPNTDVTVEFTPTLRYKIDQGLLLRIFEADRVITCQHCNRDADNEFWLFLTDHQNDVTLQEIINLQKEYSIEQPRALKLPMFNEPSKS